jgi:hypothetical protein
MSDKIATPEPQRHSPPPAVRVFKFEPPKELSPNFGATHASEAEIQGVVSTDRIRELIDAFGLVDRKEFGIPFHYMRKAHGEIWSMRIESLGGHIVNGVPVMGHQWIYRQELPERVGSSA